MSFYIYLVQELIYTRNHIVIKLLVLKPRKNKKFIFLENLSLWAKFKTSKQFITKKFRLLNLDQTYIAEAMSIFCKLLFHIVYYDLVWENCWPNGFQDAASILIFHILDLLIILRIAPTIYPQNLKKTFGKTFDKWRSYMCYWGLVCR